MSKSKIYSEISTSISYENCITIVWQNFNFHFKKLKKNNRKRLTNVIFYI